MKWHCKQFEELTTRELFEIYKARCVVFVVEQHCFYQDVDEDDLRSYHLFLEEEGALRAYCRIIPCGQYVKIGRVLTTEAARGKGYARELMQRSLEFIRQQWGHGAEIHIQAQSYLTNFYQSFGFLCTSEEYLEAGVPHVDMVLTIN